MRNKRHPREYIHTHMNVHKDEREGEKGRSGKERKMSL